MTDGETGKILEVPYPFVIEEYDEIDEDGHCSRGLSWRPGTKFVIQGIDEIFGETTRGIAEGMGHMLITPIKRVELPGHYHTRIFYIRQWRDPDGRIFGKTKLRVTTQQGFKRLLGGFRYSYALEVGK